MLSINTNISSLIAQSSMKQSTAKLNQAVERMTTGFKINHAKDNAANYSIATDMTTKINSYMVAEDNAAMGLDLISTAEGTLNQIQDKLERLRALQEQASNGTYGEQSLNAINAEANALVDEINRLYTTAEYNGLKLFGASANGDAATVSAASVDSISQLSLPFPTPGAVAPENGGNPDGMLGIPTPDPPSPDVPVKPPSFTSPTYAPNTIILHIGASSDWASQVGVSTKFELEGLEDLRMIGLDSTTDYLTQIDDMLALVSEKQTHFGAVSNRLESVLEEITIQRDNLISSRSTIRDADIAEVSSHYIQQQILQQASATLLATANQSPSIALQLI